MNIGETINKIKDDPKFAEQLLYPGKDFGDYDIDALAVEVLPSGFPSLDRMMLFKKGRGELIFVGARPSQGKSSLLTQLATHFSSFGRVHFISLEDNHQSIATRQTARILCKPMDAIQRGFVPRQDLVYAQDIISRINMGIDDNGGLNVHQICDRIRMWNKKAPLAAAFVDYIQIIRSERKVSRAEDLAMISAELKALAQELRIPLIVASQLNRQSESQDTKGRKRDPQLSDLRDSGALEQDADVAILIDRKGIDAKLIVAKNKNGPTGTVSMRYAGAQCAFIDGGESGID